MPDQSTSAEGAPASERELREEIARRDEEILRLRDLLIARDAELGAAKGRLAMIEEGSRRIADAAARSPIPGTQRILTALAASVQRGLR
jgi:hypothetical protein